MRIDYIDNMRRDEVMLSYSRTWQALKEHQQGKFDAVLADVARSEAKKKRTQITGRDSIIAETAQRFSQAADFHGKYDPVLCTYTRNGDRSCV